MARRSADHARVERTGIRPTSSDSKREHSIKNYGISHYKRKGYHKRGTMTNSRVAVHCFAWFWHDNSFNANGGPTPSRDRKYLNTILGWAGPNPDSDWEPCLHFSSRQRAQACWAGQVGHCKAVD